MCELGDADSDAYSKNRSPPSQRPRGAPGQCHGDSRRRRPATALRRPNPPGSCRRANTHQSTQSPGFGTPCVYASVTALMLHLWQRKAPRRIRAGGGRAAVPAPLGGRPCPEEGGGGRALACGRPDRPGPAPGSARRGPIAASSHRASRQLLRLSKGRRRLPPHPPCSYLNLTVDLTLQLSRVTSLHRAVWLGSGGVACAPSLSRRTVPERWETGLSGLVRVSPRSPRLDPRDTPARAWGGAGPIGSPAGGLTRASSASRLAS